MNWLSDLLQNHILINALSAWAVAQVLKTIIFAFTNKDWSWERLFGDGGMPSGHSATVTAMATTAGLEYGMTNYRFRSGRRQPGEFSPYYNIGLAGGVSHRFITMLSKGMPQLGVAAGLSGEYHFTPYSGVRFTADYAEAFFTGHPLPL